MRNSYVDIHRNGPDTSELDAGWDFEGNAAAQDEELDSLRPSHTTVRPSRATPHEAVTWTKPQMRGAAALIGAMFVTGAALGVFSIERERTRLPVASAPAAVIQAELPPPLEATSAPAADAPLPEPGEVPAVASETETGTAQPGPTRRVLLQVEPAGANVFVNGQRIGSDLVNVDLDQRERERVTITLAGHRTRVVEVDGSVKFLRVRLDRMPRPRRAEPPAPIAPAAAAPSTAGDGESGNPEGSGRANGSNADSASNSNGQNRSAGEADIAYPE